MKDYSRNSYRTDTKRFSNKRLGNTMLILACVFALAALSDFMHQHWDVAQKMMTSIKTFSQKIPTKKEMTASNKKPDVKKIATANTQPRFDFYKLLPEMTVNVTPTEDNNNH